MSEIRKLDLRKDDKGSGFTTLHTSKSDKEPHCTWKASDHAVHVYGLDYPWPIGKTADKWISPRGRQINKSD